MPENALKTNQNKKVRQSGVELLKIFAILLIILSHCTQTYEKINDFNFATTDVQLLLLRIFRFNGQIGNIIFIVCSSWFLLDSKGIKKNKAINLALDSQIISIGIFTVFITLSLIFRFNVNYSIGLFVRNIFPDIFGQVWFVPTYIIFYLINPFLNKIVYSVSKREHFGICLFIFAVYGFWGMLKGGPAYSELLGFTMIYFIVAYFKLYCLEFTKNKKQNLTLFICFFVLFISTVIIKNFLYFRFNCFGKYPEINYLLSVFLLPMLLCLFFVFLNTDIKSRFINYASSLSLFVYCIHENAMVRESLRPKICEFLIGKTDSGVLCVLILFVMFAFASFIAAWIYKGIIHRLTAKISLKAETKITEITDKLFDKSQKILK